MVTQNLQHIRHQIAKTGVEPSSIRLVAVTKYQTIEKIREALTSGILDLAVNYAQEGEQLHLDLASTQEINWHFIGHIQSRKIKFLPKYSLVQSFERLDLAKNLNRLLEEKKQTLKVLIEINIGGESQKSGIEPSELTHFLEDLSEFKNIVPAGLMTMPPITTGVEVSREYFKEMRKLYEKHAKFHGFEFLSMGTSQDFLIAIEEGANMVRLGTSLFGARSS